MSGENKQSYNISYGNISLNVVCEENVLNGIKQELEPFFIISNSASNVPGAFTSLDLRLESLPQKHAALKERAFEEVVVDTSLYPHLRSNGKRWGDEDEYLIQIDLTETYFYFSKTKNYVSAYNQDISLLIRDSVRLIKSLFTINLERNKAVQLHSSGVVIDGKSVLLMGDMWQGKTTILLELLQSFHTEQLSCDTTVITADGRTFGWPSPFSVSHGTLADHPKLYNFFPDDRKNTKYDILWKEGKKSILTSNQVVEAYKTAITPTANEIQACFYIRYKPDEPTRIKKINEVEKICEYLQVVYLGSRDPIYHNWHKFLECDENQINRNIKNIASEILSKCEFYELTWAPSVVSLFKGVPFLAEAHKDLTTLLSA